MSALVSFFQLIASVVSSFFHGVWELLRLVAAAYHAIPSYLGVWSGIFLVWIVAGLGCCVIFRILGRE